MSTPTNAARLTPPQHHTLDLISWGSVYRDETGGRFRIIAGDSSQTITMATFRALSTNLWIKVGDLNGLRRPITLTEKGWEIREQVSPTVRLRCLNGEVAARVAAEGNSVGNPQNMCRAVGDQVVIYYVDKRFPLDVAEWAGENGHASGSAVGSLIGAL
jgi:hypothetical protein